MPWHALNEPYMSEPLKLGATPIVDTLRPGYAARRMDDLSRNAQDIACHGMMRGTLNGGEDRWSPRMDGGAMIAVRMC